jgi:hypothetical protein
MSKIYEKIDEFLMYGTNGLVHSWNQVTGRTKTDLAAILNGVAPAFEISGFLSSNPIMGAISSAVFLSLSYSYNHSFRRQEANENRDRTNRTMRNCEDDNENYAIGTLWGATAAVQFAVAIN